jgi:hypothetical protein
MNHQVATAILFEDTQSSCVAMLLWRRNLSPFAFAQSLVNENTTLSTGASNQGAVLAAVFGPHDIGRGSWLSAAGNNKTLALN